MSSFASRPKLRLSSAIIVLLIVLSACSSGTAATENATVSGSSGPSSEADNRKAENTGHAGPNDAEQPERVPVKLITAWYAKGEDGGLFAALQEGYYAERGVDMTIEPGGPQVSSLQVVASGQADFGISYADSILQARERGIPVVGLMAVYQSVPQVLIYHKDHPVNGFEDVEGKTVYISPGTLYWQFIKNKFGLKHVREMNYNGQLVNFINDKMSLNQGYVTNEPFILKKQGIDVSYLRVADSGYANYGNVLFTTEKFLAEHPDIVEAVVQASRKGWEYYLEGENYREVNELIKTYNPDGDLETFHNEAVESKSLIYDGEALEHGIGYMTKERWERLQAQLIEIGELGGPQNIDKAFTTEFLAK